MTTILSLDIQRNYHREIDISGFFSLSAVHAMSNLDVKMPIDEILPFRGDISLHMPKSIEISPFETFPMLDIVLPELITSSYWQKKYPTLAGRRREIRLIEPLVIPSGSLDIRTYQSIPRRKTYADLFTRRVSYTFKTRRYMRQWSNRILIHKKPILRFLAMCVLVFLPTIFYTKFSVENGYNTLKSLAYAKNMTEVQEKTTAARRDFERAQFLFLPFSWIPLETVDLVNRATAGGQSLARSLDTLVHMLPSSDAGFSLKIQENHMNSLYRGNAKDIFPLENLGISLPTNWLSEHSSEMKTVISEFQRAGALYSGVRGDSKYATLMRQVGEVMISLSPVLAQYENAEEMMLTLLGHKDPQRYIIFNQNRDEIRANGGFPGSVITFTMYKGNILDFRTDDVYYYDWNLYPHKEAPPPGISLLTNNYGLRDVNYYPDFLDTLEKANAFVERSGDSTLTTGIAIHQGLVEDMLQIIGEVRVEGIEESFRHDNFSLLMSILVENRFAQEKTPKDILFRFMQQFGKQAIESRKITDIAGLIQEYWARGEILMASRNPQIQEFLTSLQKPLPWHSDEKNWIYPLFTSVSGNKSDRYISRALETKIKSLGECRYETTAHLTLEHTFSQNDAEKVENYMNIFGLEDAAEREKMRFIQGNGRNKNFVRLYVPPGAILSGSGAEISEEPYATVFSFMMETPVGGKTTKTLSYTQEIPDCADYNEEVSVYRQP